MMRKNFSNSLLSKLNSLKYLTLITGAFILAACAGKDEKSSASASATTPPPNLVSIAITPQNMNLPVELSQQFVATGTYSDGSTAAITKDIAWTSSTKFANIVQASGLATAKSPGEETITATVGKISGKTTLNVIYPYTQVAAGGNFSLTLKATGSLLGSGLNRTGQLGDGTFVDSLSLIPTAKGLTLQTLSAGEFHSAALLSDGTLYMWGFNQNGQLGDGTFIDKNIPIKMNGTWLSVSAGKSHTLAVKKDGTLWAWGRNFFGQLGDKTFIDRPEPTQIGTDKNWTLVAAGHQHSLARKSDGTIWAWGDHSSGQLGLGVITNVNIPTQINKDTFIAIAGGAKHSLAIRADGSLFAWGNNEDGQVGDSSVIVKNMPLQIAYDTKWSQIAAGAKHSLAIKTDGTLWAWGNNASGQVGSTQDSFTNPGTPRFGYPVQIGGDKTWKFIAAGYYHSIATKADGTLWAWGQNTEGQLGRGSKENMMQPAIVP